jgi:hypothetical protein
MRVKMIVAALIAGLALTPAVAAHHAHHPVAVEAGRHAVKHHTVKHHGAAAAHKPDLAVHHRGHHAAKSDVTRHTAHHHKAAVATRHAAAASKGRHHGVLAHRRLGHHTKGALATKGKAPVAHHRHAALAAGPHGKAHRGRHAIHVHALNAHGHRAHGHESQGGAAGKAHHPAHHGHAAFSNAFRDYGSEAGN